MITPWVWVSGTSTSAVMLCERFLMFGAVSSVKRRMPPICDLATVAEQVDAPGQCGVLPFGDAVVEREHLVLGGFDQNMSCSWRSLWGSSAARSFDWVQSRST